MVVFVKNMVCDRCVMVVRQRLQALNLDFENVELGSIALRQPLSSEGMSELKRDLQLYGFEVLDDQKASLVSQIKSCIIKYVHGNEESTRNRKFSVLLAETMKADYNYLSSLFSAVEGITIEKYLILQRVERAKELLTYNELNVNEIATSLGYTSVQHLSQQFKKITGLTPTQYKEAAREIGRQALDEVGS